MKLSNDVDSDLNPDRSRIFLSWSDDPDPEQPELTFMA